MGVESHLRDAHLQADADPEELFAFPCEPWLGSCLSGSESGAVGRVSMMNPNPVTLKADKPWGEGMGLGLGEGLPQVTLGWGVV